MDFRELGLTTNEARAYETMLRLGKSSASQISKESQVPYGRIYTVLASLEEKGLIRTVPEETKKYIASDPVKLQQIIDARIKSLADIKGKIHEFKTLYDEATVEPVQVVKGKNNFFKINREMVRPKEYSYSIKYTFDVHPEFIRGTKNDLARGIDVRALGRFDAETKRSLAVWNKIHSNIKPIHNEGIAMSIQDDDRIMIAMIKSNTIMLIRDKPFVKIMKELFKSYYDTH